MIWTRTTKNRRLRKAVLTNDVKGVETWLRRGADPHLMNDYVKAKGEPPMIGETLFSSLLWETSHLGEKTTPEQLEIASMLVGAGVDVDEHLQLDKKTALVVGADRDDPNLCRWAIDHGADIHHRTLDQESAFFKILSRERTFLLMGEGDSRRNGQEIIEILVENGATLDDVVEFDSMPEAVQRMALSAIERHEVAKADDSLRRLQTLEDFEPKSMRDEMGAFNEAMKPSVRRDPSL